MEKMNLFVLSFKVKENVVVNFNYFDDARIFNFTLNGISLPIFTFSSFDNTFTTKYYVNSEMFASIFKDLETSGFYKFFELISFRKLNLNEIDDKTKKDLKMI